MKNVGRLVSTYVWLFGWVWWQMYRQRRHPLLKGGDIGTLFVVADEGVATSLGETHNVR